MVSGGFILFAPDLAICGSTSGLILLIAFIPLFQLEKIITENNIRRGYIYYYSAFLLWNVFATYWIYNATLAGAIAACTLNALQMALIFGAFRWFKRKTKPALAYLFFVLAWLAWSIFIMKQRYHGRGRFRKRICDNNQEYSVVEYTGVLGGSLWALIVNLLLF